MEIKVKEISIIIILFILLILSIIVALSLGTVKIPIITGIKGGLTTIEQTIIYKIRLPRILLAALVGMALSTSGVVFQGIFKNVMADPYIIGVSSGASLGVSLAINFGLIYYWRGISSLALFAFLGGIITSFLVYSLAKTKGRIPTSTLLLSGIAVSFFLSSLVSLVMILDSGNLQKVFYWLMGSLANGSWQEVKMILPAIILGFLIVYFLADNLNILLLGEETAYYLGVEVERIKLLLLVAGSLLASMAVAVSGIIGFVGLVVPHVLRLILGPNHRILLPASALGGAILLIVTDTIARTILAPTELPVGIITALCGAPFFIYLLQKRKVKF
ncbi:iron complex transport system permease protein [Orenia metallireducens]|uniref:Iron complex transport system permease protein n=1 Tax=Orenia metallireducens TaxID=1413210 RepID=A0A285GW92_9FIRM|nr:iron chelate uptake ABC transporter family permease subunit [Orenia metallireducens]PRX31104.1 iron complex transport system permease protein [Orenia metallireducens]SNY27574.1 iron complex transport system permease protein [Orenia metallireducens]